MKKFVFFSALILLILSLSSCVLIKDNVKPLISNFTKSATLLSQKNISFSANVIDTGSGVESVVFEINDSPLPTFKTGTSVYMANWIGVYGSPTVTVLAQDKAGNLATKTDSFFVNDSTPPIVEVNAPQTVAVGVKFPITLKAYDIQSGVKKVSLEIDGENVPITNDNTIDWTFSDIGNHEILVTAVNRQGLVSMKKIDIMSINARNVLPYVQFVKFPSVVKSDQSATFTIYAYSPNGIGIVNLNFGKSEKKLYANSNNIYTFVLEVGDVKDSLIQATCTVYDGVGVKKVIHKEVVALSKNSTVTVIVPKFSVKTKKVQIPFFVASLSKLVKISALIDGIPVNVEGSFPKMMALWNSSPGNHVLGIALNGNVVKEMSFSSITPETKVVAVTNSSTQVIVEFSNVVKAYADPVFEIDFGNSMLLLDKKDIVVDGNKVFIPSSVITKSCSARIIGLRDFYGRILSFSFKIER